MSEKTERQCRACYRGVPQDARFCPYCGAPLPVYSPARRESAKPLPTEIKGNCAILRKSLDSIPIAQVGRLIAKELKKPLFDITRMITATRGFLAKDVPEDSARRLIPKIEELGVDIFVVPMESLSVLPEVGRFGSGTFSRDGLKCEVIYWDGWQSIERPWSDVILISCGRISRASSPTARKELEGVPETEADEGGAYQFLMDIILNDGEKPGTRIRIEEHLPHASEEEMTGITTAIITEAELMQIARQIVQFSADIPKNEGVRKMAFDGAKGYWERATFQTRRDFDDYNVWLLELVKYGFELPE